MKKEYRKMSSKDVAGLQHLRHRNANAMVYAAENGKAKAEKNQCQKKEDRQW